MSQKVKKIVIIELCQIQYFGNLFKSSVEEEYSVIGSWISFINNINPHHFSFTLNTKGFFFSYIYSTPNLHSFIHSLS